MYGVPMCPRCGEPPAKHDRHTEMLSCIRNLRERAETAERAFALCAHAIGVEYAPDSGPSFPGPVDAVVDAIREAVWDRGEPSPRTELGQKALAFLANPRVSFSDPRLAEEAYAIITAARALDTGER